MKEIIIALISLSVSSYSFYLGAMLAMSLYVNFELDKLRDFIDWGKVIQTAFFVFGLFYVSFIYCILFIQKLS